MEINSNLFSRHVAFRHEAFKSLTKHRANCSTFLRFLSNQTKGDKRAIFTNTPPEVEQFAYEKLPKKQRIVFELLNPPNATPPAKK